MLRRIASLLLLVALLVSLRPAQTAQAARGVPGSAEFGYGASLNLDGAYLDEALYLTNALQLDWLAIDLNWAELEPQPEQFSDWGALSRSIHEAIERHIPVLLRLTSAPEWVITAQGPEPGAAVHFLTEVFNRYPDGIQALELFPAANTYSGWGAAPDPSAYAALFSIVQSEVLDAQPQVLLAAGGLRPVASTSDSLNGMDDLDFLQGLYDAGLGETMQIVSLELANLHGEPLDTPTRSDPHLLRHYEQVRQVMVSNNHSQGLIWITQLEPPSGTI